MDAALDAALNGAGSGRPGHVVLACTSVDATVTLLRLLAATRGVSGGTAHLAGVVACVSAELLHEEPARGLPMPGLLAQLAPGEARLMGW